MKAKTILITISVSITGLILSCFDHNSIRSGNQSIPVNDDSPMALKLESTLKSVNDSVQLAFNGKELYTSMLIKSFYTLNNNYPVWTSGMEPNRYARELMRLFAKAQYYGLDTNFYQFTELKALYFVLKEKEHPELNKKALEYELLMTHNCFKIMSHLHAGVLNPDNAVYGTSREKYPEKYAEKLAGFINTDRLTEGIEELQPKSYEYRRLQKGLVQFISHSKLSADTFQMPDPAKDSLLAYEKAHEILMALNYLKTDNSIDETFEIELERYRKTGPEMQASGDLLFLKNKDQRKFMAALKEFQKDHGLSPDGKIGLNTIKALQLNNRERFEQIAVNLERLRWEKNKPSKYVYVNIPAYKLRIIDSFNIVRTFKVVVGTPWSQTPMLNSDLEYFTTTPDWYVPHSISSKEILPKVKKDSTYLARHNYIILNKDRIPVSQVDWSTVETSNFNFFLQQTPGAGNAMGKIKFYFENPYTVFIHDTNEREKFNKDIRAYSHGCMRLHEPGEFASELLRLEKREIADSIQTWLDNKVRKVIRFNEKIPLYVRYVTCEADHKGHIVFYPDIYEKDLTIRNQLFANKEL